MLYCHQFGHITAHCQYANEPNQNSAQIQNQPPENESSPTSTENNEPVDLTQPETSQANQSDLTQPVTTPENQRENSDPTKNHIESMVVETRPAKRTLSTITTDSSTNNTRSSAEQEPNDNQQNEEKKNKNYQKNKPLQKIESARNGTNIR